MNFFLPFNLLLYVSLNYFLEIYRIIYGALYFMSKQHLNLLIDREIRLISFFRCVAARVIFCNIFDTAGKLLIVSAGN